MEGLSVSECAVGCSAVRRLDQFGWRCASRRQFHVEVTCSDCPHRLHASDGEGDLTPVWVPSRRCRVVDNGLVPDVEGYGRLLVFACQSGDDHADGIRRGAVEHGERGVRHVRSDVREERTWVYEISCECPDGRPRVVRIENRRIGLPVEGACVRSVLAHPDAVSPTRAFDEHDIVHTGKCCGALEFGEVFRSDQRCIALGVC